MEKSFSREAPAGQTQTKRRLISWQEPVESDEKRLLNLPLMKPTCALAVVCFQ